MLDGRRRFGCHRNRWLCPPRCRFSPQLHRYRQSAPAQRAIAKRFRPLAQADHLRPCSELLEARLLTEEHQKQSEGPVQPRGALLAAVVRRFPDLTPRRVRCHPSGCNRGRGASGDATALGDPACRGRTSRWSSCLRSTGILPFAGRRSGRRGGAIRSATGRAQRLEDGDSARSIAKDIRVHHITVFQRYEASARASAP
jgi:hypothetical protein